MAVIFLYTPFMFLCQCFFNLDALVFESKKFQWFRQFNFCYRKFDNVSNFLAYVVTQGEDIEGGGGVGEGRKEEWTRVTLASYFI